MKHFCFNFQGEKYWKDPDDFNPDRFINDNNEIQTPDAFIPFGYGKRFSHI
jgi:cytochrome P450